MICKIKKNKVDKSGKSLENETDKIIAPIHTLLKEFIRILGIRKYL